MSIIKALLLTALITLTFCQHPYLSYALYKLKYGYKFSQIEQVFRTAIFSRAVEYIRGHNNEIGKTYFQEVNHFSHLTREEFFALYFELKLPVCIVLQDGEEFAGLPPTHPIPWNSTTSIKKQSLTKTLTANASAWAPKPVDWTKVPNVITPVKDQANCGACYAFSSVAAVQSLYYLSYGTANLDLSEQQLVDCSHTHGNLGCGGGDMINAFNFIRDRGITTEAAYPYIGNASASCQIKGGSFTISGYTEVPEGNCKALAAALVKRPISVGVDASNFQYYKNGTFRNCTMQPNHGVLLVGVNSQQWKIKNSWGTDWGEDGYIRLSAINGNDTCNVCFGGVYPNK